jgi:hypothetical protein
MKERRALQAGGRGGTRGCIETAGIRTAAHLAAGSPSTGLQSQWLCFGKPRNCLGMPRSRHLVPRTRLGLPRMKHFFPRSVLGLPRLKHLVPRTNLGKPRPKQSSPGHSHRKKSSLVRVWGIVVRGLETRFGSCPRRAWVRFAREVARNLARSVDVRYSEPFAVLEHRVNSYPLSMLRAMFGRCVLRQ